VKLGSWRCTQRVAWGRVAAVPWLVIAGCNAPVQFDVGAGGSGAFGGTPAADAMTMGGSPLEAGIVAEAETPSNTSFCHSDDDCPSLSHCDSLSGRCFQCLDDDDCSGNNRPRCDTATHLCVECGVDADCRGAGQVCRAQQCLSTCTDNSQCPPAAPTCDIARAFCIRCGQDGDCPPSLPVCNVATGQCVDCTSNDTCASPLARCDRSRNVCVQCLISDDCPPGEASICDPTRGACVERDDDNGNRRLDGGRTPGQ
jgi:hypothetical protein